MTERDLQVLRAVRGARGRMEGAKERIHLIMDAAEHITPGYGGERVQSGRLVDPVAAAVAALDEQRIILAERAQEYVQAVGAAEAVIQRVQDERLRDVLTWRYVNCWPWWRVAEAAGVSERWVYVLHDRAIK